ncbi:MAG: diaminopimelate decarboxylase [Firmicutes bacterium]|nr:diaminopimelate decarboxylase [Bacillota bacterium]
MRPDTFQQTSSGHISIGGVPVSTLAEKFGTPLYVLDYDTMVHRMQEYRNALAQLQPAGWACYAGKAFLCRAMVELVAQEGLGLDVVSGGELYTALQAGFDPKNILFHGNVKTAAELRFGLEAGVGQFVVDSLDELDRLNRIADEMGRTAPVLLRLTPGIDAHTHDFIRTGQFDSKFGFGIGDGIADEAVRRALAAERIQLNGFHAHIGSQILEGDPFVANAEALMAFSQRWHQMAGFWPRILDIGGGLGVRYTGGEEPPQLAHILRRIQGLLTEATPPGAAVPKILMEPGRSIVAEAGVTLYTVEAVKTVVGGKVYVAVDGGMGDNIRPALYQAQYAASLDGKPESTPPSAVTVAGRYCESGDILLSGVPLADPQVGDRLIVWATGAYNYSMASTYNRVPRPAVVVVRDGEVSRWVERERWEDVTRLDLPLNARKSVNA